MKRILVCGFLVLSALSTVGGQPATTPKGRHPNIRIGSLIRRSQAPPTDAECRAEVGITCYSPQEMRQAYGLTKILADGYQGAGQTIVIVVAFGSPTLANDVHIFDQGYGLPDPQLKVIAPFGTVPFDPTNGDMVNWASETTLDVTWSHVMAPAAEIILVVSLSDQDSDILNAEQYAVNHHLGKILSMSYGEPERDQDPNLTRQEFGLFLQAALDQMTCLASAGDTGSAGGDNEGNLIPTPVVNIPAAYPYVTGIGGTSLFADTNGNYQSEIVWNDTTVSLGATGGGVSELFAEPLYQFFSLGISDQALLKGHRGVPDIAYNADVATAILVAITFFPDPDDNGYYFIGGTSEGAPQWAGITADANQYAGYPMGLLNTRLYPLGGVGLLGASFHDITSGNNSFAGIPGFTATKGWDRTTGWGTPNVQPLFHLIQH